MTTNPNRTGNHSPRMTDPTRPAAPDAGRALRAALIAGDAGLVTRSLVRPRPSVALEISHRHRVRAAEDALDAAKASGDPEAVQVAMRDLDDVRERARLWAR